MNKIRRTTLLGAAYLMATSAIGPGFLTQTTVFTQKLGAAFGFAIVVSVVLDIIAQRNIWRILTVTNTRAQDLANELLPGLGYFLAALVVLGGLVFNIANVGGCGLGLKALMGLDTTYGAIISCVIALVIFWMKDSGKVMDWFTLVLGILMILLTLYTYIFAFPNPLTIIKQLVMPDTIDTNAIITLVGGTVGGYISFAGAHRLLDAGVSGKESIKDVDASASKGIKYTLAMRFLLFGAALGVIAKGYQLDPANPTASVYGAVTGELGYRVFGMVMWSAAITSVVGAAYTSVSFLKTLHPFIAKNEKWFITFFIIFSTAVFTTIGNPVHLLVMAGALNGLILPIALAVMLIAISKRKDYEHPYVMTILGWGVVGIMAWLSIMTLKTWML